MHALTTADTLEEEVASPCMTVMVWEGFSERICEAAREAAGSSMSQPKRVAPWRAKRVAIVKPLLQPGGWVVGAGVWGKGPLTL